MKEGNGRKECAIVGTAMRYVFGIACVREGMIGNNVRSRKRSSQTILESKFYKFSTKIRKTKDGIKIPDRFKTQESNRVNS